MLYIEMGVARPSMYAAYIRCTAVSTYVSGTTIYLFYSALRPTLL